MSSERKSGGISLELLIHKVKLMCFNKMKNIRALRIDHRSKHLFGQKDSDKILTLLANNKINNK